MSKLAPIALTVGEPAGIGPDLVVALAQQARTDRIVAVGDITLLEARATQLGIAARFVPYHAAQTAPHDALEVYHVPLTAPACAGQLNPANAAVVLHTLDIACDGCLSGEFLAMVTAPVHKGVINDAGFVFSGHTEYLAQRAGVPQVVMMLVGGGMRVALVTTHIPLRTVADAITLQHLTDTLTILYHALQDDFGIASPRIIVAGLNPHAGESGHLGREEIEIIIPVLDRLRTHGWQLDGPLPADTLFTPAHLTHCDAVLAMYHDQGLPVLKHASFGQGVNITLGLPFIRTSVDHGTALSLAGRGQAHSGSLDAAVVQAVHLVQRRQTLP